MNHMIQPNLIASVDQYDLVVIYCGQPSEWRYPPEILQMCLTFGGLIGRSRHCTFFWIYS